MQKQLKMWKGETIIYSRVDSLHAKWDILSLCSNFDDYGLQLWKPFHNILILNLGFS